MFQPRIAVMGAGSFGKNHVRILHEWVEAQLSGVLDIDVARASAVAAERGCQIFESLGGLARESDASWIATPTITHAEIGCRLIDVRCDVLVEKPIAHDVAAAQTLVEGAERTGRILQVGHLERFNPAIIALS